jgi:hypothetical protein
MTTLSSSMTTLSSSKSRLGRHTLAVAALAIIAVAGSVWAKGSGSQTTAAVESPRIDVVALHSSIVVANLPVLQVEQPF